MRRYFDATKSASLFNSLVRQSLESSEYGMKTRWTAPEISEFSCKPWPKYYFSPPPQAFYGASDLYPMNWKSHSSPIPKSYPTTPGPRFKSQYPITELSQGHNACPREKSGGRNLPHQKPREFPTNPGHTRKLPAVQPDQPTSQLPPSFLVTQPPPPPPHHDPRPTPPKTPHMCPEPLDPRRGILTPAELLKTSEPGNISVVSNSMASLWCSYTS